MRWGENDTYQFIKIYLTHNCLWDPENENYRVKCRRQDAHKRMISQFYNATNIKLNETEVRQKIKNLRGTYLQELVKIKLRSRIDAHYKSNLKWFYEYHKCMQSVRKPKERSSCDDEIQQDSKDECSQKVWIGDNSHIDNDNEDTNKDTDDSHKDPFMSPPDDDFMLLLKTEPEEVKQDKKMHNPYKVRRRKTKRRDNRSDWGFRESIDSSESAREDEFDIYGKYIATQLRGMGLDKALRVQLKIQSIVSEARMEDC